MQRLRFTGYILQPSVSSFVGSIFIAVLILVVSAVSFGSENGFIYDLLLGPGSSAELIETSRGVVATFNETVFGNATLNKILFFGFWMVVGMGVYLLVSGIGSSIAQAEQSVHEMHYANIRRHQLESSFVLRTILRLVFSTVWIFYIVLFLKLFLPFSVLSTRIGLAQLGGLTGWLYLVMAFVVLTVSLQLHIVMIRLICLRPRIFGGWDVVDESTHINN